jgi:hypothetical protein
MRTTSLALPTARERVLGVAEARADLCQARLRLMGEATLLRRDLERATDWRALGRRHPFVSALAVAGAGLLLLRLVRPP